MALAAIALDEFRAMMTSTFRRTQILGEWRKLVQAAVGRPELPEEVSTFSVSSFSQTLLKCLEKRLGWLRLAQGSDPVNGLLLRVCIADRPECQREWK